VRTQDRAAQQKRRADEASSSADNGAQQQIEIEVECEQVYESSEGDRAAKRARLVPEAAPVAATVVLEFVPGAD
jgi:hypothetical protein